jgi:ATP-dependent Clp protease ATP-binding subunit ClpA
VLSQELEFSLNSAFRDARSRGHEYITVEHLLSALLDNPSAAKVLRACGGKVDELRDNLSEFLDKNVPSLGKEDENEAQPTTSRTSAGLTW